MLAPLLMNMCLLLSLKSRYLKPYSSRLGIYRKVQSLRKKQSPVWRKRLDEQLDDLEQYTRRTNIRIFGIPEPTGTDPENTDAKAIDFFANQLGITVSSDHITRSHRTGKRGRTPRPIIVRLVHHNMKVQLLRKRRELKAQETNFDIREDLT